MSTYWTCVKISPVWCIYKKTFFIKFVNNNNWLRFIKARQAMPRGSIIIFPSYTWHRVTPVTRGTRLSLVQWNLGPGYI